MKTNRLVKGCFAALLLAAAVAPGQAGQTQRPVQDSGEPGFSVRNSRGSDFAIFGSKHIGAGTTHSGEVIRIFGDVAVDGTVTGEVIVIFGNLTINGAIEDDTVAVLSNVSFGPEGRVDGDFTSVLGTMTGEPNVGGDKVHIPMFFVPHALWAPFGALGTLVTWIAVIWIAVLFFLMVLLTAVVPDRIRTITGELPSRLPTAFLAGLGAYVGLLLVNGVLIATVIGIPLAGIVWAIFLMLKWVGMAGIYQWVGRGIGRIFGAELSLLPAVLLGFLPFALLQLAPVLLGGVGLVIALGIRVLLWLFVEVPAVGLAILTRGGGRPRATTPLTIPVVPMVPIAPAPTAAT